MYNASDVEFPYQTLNEAVRDNLGMYLGGNNEFALIILYLSMIDDLISSIEVSQLISIDIEIMPDDSCFIRDTILPNEFKLTDSIFQSWLDEKSLAPPIFYHRYDKKFNPHAFGASCAAAIGLWCHAEIITSECIYSQSFNKGNPNPTIMRIKDDLTKPCGKVLHFLPDPALFVQNQPLAWYSFFDQLRSRAVLYPNLTISFHDHRNNQRAVIQYIDGFLGYFYEFSHSRYNLSNVIHCHGVYEECHVTIIFNFSYSAGFLRSFANQELTKGNGSHVAGFSHGLTQSIIKYIYKIKNINLNPDEVQIAIKPYINALVAIQMPKLEWEGAIRYELASQQAFDAVSTIIIEQFEQQFTQLNTDEQRYLEWILRDLEGMNNKENQ